MYNIIILWDLNQDWLTSRQAIKYFTRQAIKYYTSVWEWRFIVDCPLEYDDDEL